MENSNSRIPNEYAYLEENQTHISKFLRIMSKGIERHGIKKITSILVNMDIHSEFENKGTANLVKFICDEVVLSYNKNREDKMTVDDLFKKDKRGDCTLARKMAILLLKQFVKISPTKLGEFFNRSRQVIHMAHEEFKALNPKLVQDLDFLNRHDEISQKVVIYMEQNSIDLKK